MRTAEELRKEITEKRISELEDSVTEDVKLAWDTLEEMVISNDDIKFICLEYNNGSILQQSILNSECFCDLLELLKLKGYRVDEEYDSSAVITDERGYIKFNKDAKIIGYMIRWDVS